MCHKKCNYCQFFKKNVVHDGQNSKFFNFICLNNPLSPRYINYSVPEGTVVEAPNFCPLKTEENFDGGTTSNGGTTTQNFKSEKILTEREKWDNVIPQTKWDEIKSHEIYHIPPFLGSPKRKNIEIVYVCPQYFTYKDISEGVSYNISYIYPSSLLYKVMVKLKK